MDQNLSEEIYTFFQRNLSPFNYNSCFAEWGERLEALSKTSCKKGD